MTEERAPYHVEQEPAPESADEHPKALRSYFIEPEPAPEQESAHEHLYRVVVGNKTIVRFCERCGRTWLTSELRDILLLAALSTPGQRCLRRRRRVKN
jgi:hypothetical protein